MRIKAFRAMRPPVEKASVVASLPYDVGELEDARAKAHFLHFSRSLPVKLTD